MAEESDKFDELYATWLKDQNIDSWDKDKARAYFNDHNDSLDGLKIDIKEEQEETSTISHQEENEAPSPENEQAVKDSWTKYCQDNGLLEPEFKDDSLDFALYKDASAKQKDDYIAKMKYEDKGLNVKTQKGKLPDFKFFQQTAKVEKDRGMKNLKVESENPEFKAMMLAAALEAGLSIGKEQIDANLESIKKLPQELQDKIAKHNENIDHLQRVRQNKENNDTPRPDSPEQGNENKQELPKERKELTPEQKKDILSRGQSIEEYQRKENAFQNKPREDKGGTRKTLIKKPERDSR